MMEEIALATLEGTQGFNRAACAIASAETTKGIKWCDGLFGGGCAGRDSAATAGGDCKSRGEAFKKLKRGGDGASEAIFGLQGFADFVF
jgi:hypothetical protein